MKFKSVVVLNIFGVLSLLIALVFGILSLSAYLERTKYGSGLMFAGVEFFGLIAIIFLLFGFVFLFISRKIKKSNPQ